MNELKVIEEKRSQLSAILQKEGNAFNIAYGIEEADIIHPMMGDLSKYKNITFLSTDLLNLLRYKIYIASDISIVSSYADGILRYCEIFFYKLYRELSKSKSMQDVNLFIINLCNFLVDYTGLSKDPRYLNTALKILDLRSLPKVTAQIFSDRTIADKNYYLLRARVLLLVETELNSILTNEK